MRYLLLLILFLAGCAPVQIDAGRAVRMLPLNLAYDCEFLGTVESSYDNPLTSEARNRMSVVSDMKNQCAALGGNTLVLEWIMSELGTAGQAQAYRCE